MLSLYAQLWMETLFIKANKYLILSRNAFLSVFCQKWDVRYRRIKNKQKKESYKIMKNIKLVNIKKKHLIAILTLATVTMLSGCGKQPEAVTAPPAETIEAVETTEEATESSETMEVTVEDTETTEAIETEEEMLGDEADFDYPSSDVEVRVGKTSFDSYDEIIGDLQADEAYAFVKVRGYDGEVLLITNYVYDNLDGNMAAVAAIPYTMKSNGKVTADSALVAGGTANPIAIDADGVFCLASHTTMEKQCYGTNGTNDVAMMSLAYVYIDEFDADGMPATVGGYVRTENTVIDNDGKEVAKEDVAVFDQMFEDYGNAQVVGFTVIK